MKVFLKMFEGLSQDGRASRFSAQLRFGHSELQRSSPVPSGRRGGPDQPGKALPDERRPRSVSVHLHNFA